MRTEKELIQIIRQLNFKITFVKDADATHQVKLKIS